MRLLKRNLSFLLMMVFLSIITVAVMTTMMSRNQAVSSMSLTIMHMNDTHSYAEGSSGEELMIGGSTTYFDMGGYTRLTTKVTDIRDKSENTLLLHAGDAVQGTLYFTEYEGKTDFIFLNAMGVDAMCVGNHEFDKGPEYLKKFIDYADFPIISANIDTSADENLRGLIDPYMIKNYDGQKVGIIGLTTPTTEYTSSPGKDVHFNALVSTVTTYVDELEDQGINKIILLTHLGYQKDVELAESVEGVDIIVGGHSHTLLGGKDLESLGKSPAGLYPTVVTKSEGESTYVVQAWKHTLALGKLDVEFDENGVITTIEGSPILLLGEDHIQRKNEDGDTVDLNGATRTEIVTAIAENGVAEIVVQDAAAVAMLGPYKRGIKDIQSKVVASVSSNLYHTRIPFTDKHGGSGVPLPYGSYIAPLVCKSMLWKMEQVRLNVDFALQNAGGLRKTISKGNLTVGDIYELLPFGNTLYILELTGTEFKAALQSGIDTAVCGHNSGAYPYVAGCRYTVDAKTAPDDPTLTAVETQDDNGNWVAVEDDGIYRIVTNNYVADGGDYYSILKNAAGYRYDTGFVDAEVFTDYALTIHEFNRPDSTGVTYITDSERDKTHQEMLLP